MSLYICLFRHLCNRMMQFSQVALVKYHASIHFVACPMITKRSNLYKLLLFVILRDCQPRIPPPSKFERTQISPPEPRTFALSPLGGAQKFRSNPFPNIINTKRTHHKDTLALYLLPARDSNPDIRLQRAKSYH